MAHSEEDKDDEVGKLRRMDRRQFGKILVAGVGGLTLGTGAGAQEGSASKLPTLYSTGEQLTGKQLTALAADVVIVGAGLSGLIAARELKRAGKRVLVLEANSEIGGRMVGRPTKKAGGYLDYGGQWVGETQYEMIALAAELKIPLFLSYEQGRSIQSWKRDATAGDIYQNRVDTGFNGDVSDLLQGDCKEPDELPDGVQCQSGLPNCKPDAEEARIWEKLLSISQTVIPDCPWATPHAEDLDAKTFQKFLEEENAVGYTKWLPSMQSHIGGSGGFEPDQVSLLHMAWTQRVGPQSEKPEKWLLRGGAGQIPELLAKELAGYILCKSPVTRIQEFNGYINITMPAGVFTSASAVIVAIPPSLRNNIEFIPKQGTSYADCFAFNQGSHMGSMSKVHAVYDDAFWRKKCLSGSSAGNLPTCEFIADSSPPGGEPGILTSFIGGARNKEVVNLSEGEIQKLVLRDFEYYFGKEALTPREFFYRNWNNEWSGGAFTTHLGPNIWTRYGKEGWRKPVGNVFWAGTETSDRWPGYFDGAVRAGKMAAMAVLERLTEKPGGLA